MNLKNGKDNMFDITFIDIPVKNCPVPEQLSKTLNSFYELSDLILKKRTGCTFEERKYYYSSGILCLSTYLKEQNLKVGYINYPKDKEQLERMVLNSKCIGFSTVTITMDTILQLAAQMKKLNPSVKILLGGYHASYCVEEILGNCGYIDGIVIGEGEKALSAYLNGEKKESIKGFGYRGKDGKVCVNREENLLDGDVIPIPDFSLIERDIEDYNIYVGTMRGCVGRCNFCVNHNYWGKPRIMSIDKISKMFAYLDRILKSPRLIHIIDNVFTVNTKHLQNMLEILRPYQKKFRFECDTLANLIDMEKIKLLDEMNVIKIGLGFEDCVDEINKTSNKSVTFDENRRAAEMISQNSGICVYAYWLLGLPGTTEKTIETNIQMIKELILKGTVQIISPKIFIPYPGTEFWNRGSDYGLRIVSYDWSKYERISPPYPYCLDSITEVQLEKSLMRILDECIYAYKRHWNISDNDLEEQKYNTWYESI